MIAAFFSGEKFFLMPTNSQFKLSLPNGWKETTVYTFEGPLDGGVQHNLVLSILPDIDKKTSLADFARGQLSLSAAALPAFEMLSEGTHTGQSGRAVYTAVYKYTPADTVTYYQKQYFLVEHGAGYVFTSTFSASSLATVGVDVDGMVESLALPESE